MKFRKNAETVISDDPYYDLFDGGYIDPYKLLQEEDAYRVNMCLNIIREFLELAEKKGYLEYS